MRNIAIITARSGSKGLRNKNIRLLSGFPLMYYSIDAASKANLFDEIMVSTDSNEYAQIAQEYGANVPFLRSEKNSGDGAGSWDVVKEVLCKYKSMGLEYDTVCLLQPTSPLRTSEDICDAYRLYREKNGDSVTSVCEMEHSPLWSMTLEDDLSLNEFRENSDSVPRQKLPKYYRLNGAIFIRQISYENDDVYIKNDNEFAYIMEKKHSVDIDTIDDFRYAEFLMANEK